MKERDQPNSLGLFQRRAALPSIHHRIGLCRGVQKVLEFAGWLEYSLLQVSPVANYFAGVFLLKQYECHE
jgi:hypothetical protein